MSDRQYPEGQLVAIWIGFGIALFAGLGVALAVATGTPGLIAIGPAAGVGFGAAVGAGLENKARQEGRIRAQTPEERRRRVLALWAGLALFVVGVVVAALVALQ